MQQCLSVQSSSNPIVSLFLGTVLRVLLLLLLTSLALTFVSFRLKQIDSVKGYDLCVYYENS